MNSSVHVPVDDPNADTEWNDILRKHNIIPPKPASPTPLIQEALLEARKQAHEKRLEDKDLDELNELEDEEDEEFLQSYRNRRIEELSKVSKTSIFNQVFPIQKPDYFKDVTEASHAAFVLVSLTSSLGNNPESRLLTELWHESARKLGDIKFCEIRADMCIEGYPERNTPTILVYKDGDIQRQVITLKELGGMRTTSRDVERLLLDVGAVQANDTRLMKAAAEERDQNGKGVRVGKGLAKSAQSDEDLDGWD